MRLIVTPEAGQDAGVIDGWWRENRPHAPNAFIEDVLGACDSLLSKPYTRPVFSQWPAGDVRRWLLRSGHHVYYAVDAASETVIVLRIWGARRGSSPSG